MLKPLVILAMLTAPALADPSPQSIRLDVQLKTKLGTRTNTMALTDNSCGKVEEKAPDHIDEIKACARAEGANVRIDLDWSTHGDKTEYRSQSTIVLAHGGTAEVGNPDTRLVVRMP
jgi:hypothetical protein